MQGMHRSVTRPCRCSTVTTRVTAEHSKTVQHHRQHGATAAPVQQEAGRPLCCPAGAHAAMTVAAAVLLQTCVVVPQPALAKDAVDSGLQEQQQWQQLHRQQHNLPWQPILGDLSSVSAAPDVDASEEEAVDLQEIESDIMAQVAVPEELKTFMQMLQQGPPKSAEKLSAARQTVGFDRMPDGRVMLLSDDGEPFQVKNDMGVPGALLLRDAGGYLYYIPPPDSDSLVQIDLSDDAVVAQLFANHAWEELLEPLEVLASVPEDSTNQGQQEQQQPKERLEQMRLTERAFRSTVSLLAGAEELPEQPLEDLDSQETAWQ